MKHASADPSPLGLLVEDVTRLKNRVLCFIEPPQEQFGTNTT